MFVRRKRPFENATIGALRCGTKNRSFAIFQTVSKIWRSARVVFLATLAAGTAGASQAQEIKSGPGFDPDKMAAAIEAKMKPQVVAFSYTIATGGKLARQKGVGPARIAIDGYRAHGPMQRNNLASVTKTYTAVAILQLIEKNKAKGVTVDTPIAAYLPDGWRPGANVAQLTFADLLRHRTGFSSGNINGFSVLGFDAVRTMVAKGTTPVPAGEKERPRAYDNVNYALLRELMPKLWAATGTLKYEKIDGSQIWPTQGDYHSFLYAKYMNMHVFAPLDIDNVKCFDSGATATLYYPLNPDPKVKGVPAPDQSKYCGSGGLYLATNEMTKFMVYLFNTDTLLPATVRQAMIDRRLGLSATSTSRGLSYSHGGVVGVGANSQGKAGTKACMIHLPGGVDAALVQNSPDNASISPCNVLIEAFEAGWK